MGEIHKYNMEYEGIDQQVESFTKSLGINVSFPLYNVKGAQHIISKRLVRKNPIEFYKKIHEQLNHHVYPQAGLDFEKTLFQLYGIYQ